MSRSLRLPTAAAAVFLSVSAVAQTPTVPTPTPEVAPSDRLHRIVESCFDAWLELHPLIATSVGDDRFNRRFADGISEPWLAQSKATAESCLADAGTVDRRRLDAEDRLTYDLFVRETEMQLADFAFPEHLLQVSFFLSSPPFAFARMVSDGTQQFTTVEDYDDFVARMNGFATWVDLAIDAMREGIESDVVHSRLAIRPALQQLADLVVDDPRESPFWAPIDNLPRTFPRPERRRLEKAFERTIADAVVPAYARLHAFLRDVYLPAARDEVSWSELPNGAAWYAYRVRRYTSSTATPAEILATGVSEVRRILTELDRQGRRMGLDGVPGLFTELATDPSHRVTSQRAVLRRYEAIRRRVEPRLDTLFGRLPRAPLTIEPVPRYLAAGAPGAFYVPPRPQGDGRGTFFVNVRSGGVRGPGMEALFLHEALPGHHFQGALAREIEELPRFRRFGYEGAFIEGWALYAEGLGRELGLYRDPWQEVGRLLSELLRAARLVMDTGIHSAGWSEAEARKIASTRLAGFGESEIPRYAAEPAQALTYKLGQLAILELRREAEEALGDSFDPRAFHDEVLRRGPLPLDVLEIVIRDWIAAQSVPAPTTPSAPPG